MFKWGLIYQTTYIANMLWKALNIKHDDGSTQLSTV